MGGRPRVRLPVLNIRYHHLSRDVAAVDVQIAVFRQIQTRHLVDGGGLEGRRIVFIPVETIPDFRIVTDQTPKGEAMDHAQRATVSGRELQSIQIIPPFGFCHAPIMPRASRNA
jgi:hypothetical protein